MDTSHGTEALSLEDHFDESPGEARLSSSINAGMCQEGDEATETGPGAPDTARGDEAATAAEDAPSPQQPAIRPASPPVPSQQPSLADGIVGAGARDPSSSTRRVSTESLEPSPHLSVVYAKPPTSAPPTNLRCASQPSPRRHPNGLPLRYTTGPLPGMPFLSDLASRYPVREAPASGPEISLISGQLYVGGRLRRAISPRLSPDNSYSQDPLAAHPASPSAAGSQGSPYGSSYLARSFLQQRRLEKEKRARLAAPQLHHRQGHKPEGGWQWNTYPGGGRNAPGPGAAGDGNAGAAKPKHTESSRERALRESVERWLDGHSAGLEREGDSRSRDGSSSLQDPSLTYRQLGVFRTYGDERAGLRPSSSLPVLSRGGQRTGAWLGANGYGTGVEQKMRVSAGGSPSRLPQQPVGTGRPRARQTAW